MEQNVTTLLSLKINDLQMYICAHCFIVKTEVFSSAIVSFCFSDRWEASDSDAPKVDKTLPHFLPNGISIHLGVDFQELLPVIGVFRPTHRHLQVSSVRVSAEVFNNRSVCQSVSQDNEQSRLLHGMLGVLPSFGKVCPVGNHIAWKVSLSVPVHPWRGEGLTENILNIIKMVSTHPVMIGFAWSCH